MAIAILRQTVFNENLVAATHQVTGFNVPSGTSRLLVQVEYPGADDITAPPVTSVTHNGAAVTTLFTNAAPGNDDINVWWGQRANPDIGTFNIVITFPSNTAGCKAWVFAISGEKATGSILGASVSQRKAGAVTPTVGLGLTPTVAGTSLLLASCMIKQRAGETTVVWAGTGFVESETANYGPNAVYTATSRYRQNAPGGANTISATFDLSDTDIGGSLIEILAEPVGATDVTGNIAFGLAVTGSVSVTGVSGGPASARIADASYRNGSFRWTEIFLLQPDAANVDRRILTGGPAAAPNYTVDMVQTGTAGSNLYRWQYRLADGLVTVETGPGTQRTSAHVIALNHQPGGPLAYVNGEVSVSSVTGGALTGALDMGPGGMAIGGHDQASPAAYTGLIGRYLATPDWLMSPGQLRLLALSLLDADAMWGYASEDDAQVVNRSPVALPMLVEPDGRPTMTITPRAIDPDGSQPTISAITQGVHTAVAISGTADLFLSFERGWSGLDSFDYTVSDGIKASTGKISINQKRPALLARNDTISVTAGNSILFDPRSNDVGAGGLRVISVTQGTLGAAIIQADGQIRYTANP